MRPTPWTRRIATAVTALCCSVPAVASAARPLGPQSPRTFNRTTQPVAEVFTQLAVRPARGLFTPMNLQPARPLRPGASNTDVVPVTAGLPGTAAAALAAGQLASADAPGTGNLAFAPGPSGTAAGEAATRRLAPVARGGGPRGVEGADVLRLDDQLETHALTLPLGCTRISAVGTPAVRDVAIEVRHPSGHAQRIDARRGRSETVTVCGESRGQYGVSVRLRAARRDGVVASQLFVDREAESGSAGENRLGAE